MYESVSTVGLDDLGSADSVVATHLCSTSCLKLIFFTVVGLGAPLIRFLRWGYIIFQMNGRMNVAGSAYILLFVIVPYTIDLLCSLRFIFFVVRISKDLTHVTYHSLTSLVSVKMLFLQGNTFNTILINCI